jgi:hypothetical protein
MGEVTVTTTAGMIALAQDAAHDKEAGRARNRSVDVDRLSAELCPGGTHLLLMSFPHDYVDGQKVVDHLRTHWMVAVKEGVEPSQEIAGAPPAQKLWLDVSFDAFRRYTLHQKV